MKKILSFLLLTTLFLSGIYQVEAKENNIIIKSVEIIDKSDTALVTLSDYEDLNINVDVSLYKLDDYVTYKVTLKNNSDKNYKIESITDTNENEYITYSYELSDKNFKKDKEIDLLVTLKYSKLVNKKVEGLKEKLNININYDNGESTTISNSSSDSSNTNNPTTNDNIKTFIIIFSVTIVSLILLIIKKRKLKYLVLLMMLFTIPTVSALTISIELTININLNLYNEHNIVYDANGGTGTMDNQIVEDDEIKLSKNGFTKDGYIFINWNTKADGSGTTYEDEGVINIDNDTTLYAQWENRLLYNVVKYDAENDNNAGEYTGEVTDTYDEQGNEKIYYYKGENPNNNVIFGNFCWQIVRTTATGGVKMIYNGIPTDGTCNNTGVNSWIGTSAFNSNYNSPAYLGYMYNKVYTWKDGSASSGVLYGNDIEYDGTNYTLKNTSTTKDATHHYTCNNTTGTCNTVRYYCHSNYYIVLDGVQNIQEVLNEMLYDDNVNSTNSTIKTTIDNWYSSNMTSYTDYLEDTVFCNDRSISNENDTGWNPNGGSLSKYLYFSAYSRDTANLKCANETDRFSMSNSKAKLTYPVGLLSMDETLLGKTTEKYSLDNYYLKTSWNGFCWTGSPSNFVGNSGGYYVDSLGRLGSQRVDVASGIGGVRPAVSLISGTVYSDGDGSKDDPYLIEDGTPRPTRNYIYFEKPNEWATPYAYLTGDIENSWPGIKLKQVKGNLYSFRITDSMIPVEKSIDNLNFEMQFNNGGSITNSNSQYKYKLSKVNFEGFNKVYKVTTGSTSTNASSTGIWETLKDDEVIGRIYFYVPTSWEHPHAYVYRNSDEYKLLGEWPGVELTKYKNNMYYFEITKYMIDDDITNYSVTFNNGGTNYNQSDLSKKYKLSDVQIIGYGKVYNPLTGLNSTSGNSTGIWLDLN